MNTYTFEIEWPAPFVPGWRKSGQRFTSTKDAARELASFLEVSADNGVFLAGRLVEFPNGNE